MCGPEQIIFWDESEPARIEGIENAVLLLTFVAREVLGESGVDLNLGHSVFNPSNVLLRATARFIEGLLESDGTPDPMTARLVENLTHDMVGSLLLGSRAMLIDTLDHSARTYARAMRLMTAQRTNPAVTPATIAADLHVSLRQLQREFSRRGETVAGALRQLRAELAANVLRDPACDVLMMSQVAQHSGFTSSQQMRRVLAALGFPPPQELRRATKRENGCHHTNSGVGPLNAPA